MRTARATYTVQEPWLPLRPFNMPVPHPLARSLLEAPSDTGYAYGRMDGTWVPVVRIAGDTMEGRLYLYDEPEIDREASTKHYVDTRPLDTDGGYY